MIQSVMVQFVWSSWWAGMYDIGTSVVEIMCSQTDTDTAIMWNIQAYQRTAKFLQLYQLHSWLQTVNIKEQLNNKLWMKKIIKMTFLER